MATTTMTQKQQRQLDRIKREEEEIEKLLKQSGALRKEEEEEEDSTEEEEEVTEQTSETSGQTGDEETPEDDSEPATAEEKSFKKRYGDLRRHSQKEKEALEKRIADLESKLTDAPTSAPRFDESAIKEWIDNNPKVTAIVETLASKIADQRMAEIDTTLNTFREREEQVKQLEALNAVRKSHPDFDEIQKTDAFHDWAEKQSSKIQSWIYDSNDPEEIILALDLYKAKSGKTTKRSTDTSAADAVNAKGGTKVSGTQKTKWSESKVNALSDREWEKYESEIYEAMRNGNFTYDLTQRD